MSFIVIDGRTILIITGKDPRSLVAVWITGPILIFVNLRFVYEGSFARETEVIVDCCAPWLELEPMFFCLVLFWFWLTVKKPAGDPSGYILLNEKHACFKAAMSSSSQWRTEDHNFDSSMWCDREDVSQKSLYAGIPFLGAEIIFQFRNISLVILLKSVSSAESMKKYFWALIHLFM